MSSCGKITSKGWLIKIEHLAHLWTTIPPPPNIVIAGWKLCMNFQLEMFKIRFCYVASIMYENFYESFKKENNIISVYFNEKVKGAQLNYFFFFSFFFFHRWKECSNKNQLRYSESIKVLKEMKELYDHWLATL